VQVTQPEYFPAFGAWLDLNVSRTLAIETRATAARFPDTTSAQVESGVRATFVRSRRLTFYGVAMPGWYHIGLSAPNVILSRPDASAIEVGTPANAGPSSHFVLDLGAGLGISLSPRLALRVEGMRQIHAQSALNVDLTDDAGRVVAPLTFPTPIASEWDVHVGASYSIGRPLVHVPETTSGRWTAGPQVGLTISTSEAASAAVGGFVAYRLLPYFDLDASVSTFVGGSGLTPTALEGGHMAQAVAGGKVGVRRGRTGVFFKMRAGVNSYSTVGVPGRNLIYARSTVPALDLGGVIELSLSSRTLLRCDVGESLSFTPSRLTFASTSPFDEGHDYRFKLYSLPMRVAVGWRF
jgi:hypothetical protein